jgi:mRNA interferase HicA
VSQFAHSYDGISTSPAIPTSSTDSSLDDKPAGGSRYNVAASGHLRRPRALNGFNQVGPPKRCGVKGLEFIQRIKKLGRERSVPVDFNARQGKGSHGRLYYGNRFTTVKDRRKEIGRLRRGPQDAPRDIQVPLAPSGSRRVIPFAATVLRSLALLRYRSRASSHNDLRKL